jgi:hypothetical protein
VERGVGVRGRAMRAGGGLGGLVGWLDVWVHHSR